MASVMAAMAISAIVLFAVLGTLSVMQNAQSGSNTSSGFANLTSEIHLVLTNEESCTSAFGLQNQMAFAGTMAAPTPLPLKIYYPFSPTNEVLIEPSTVRSGLVVTKVEFDTSTLTASPSGQIFGLLKVEAERTGNGESQMGPAIMVRTFLMSFRVDATDRIVGCVSAPAVAVKCATGSANWQAGVMPAVTLEEHVSSAGSIGLGEAQFNQVFQAIPSILASVAVPNVPIPETTPGVPPNVWGIRCRPNYLMTNCNLFTGTTTPALVKSTNTFSATNGCYGDDISKGERSTIFATCCESE